MAAKLTDNLSSTSLSENIKKLRYICDPVKVDVTGGPPGPTPKNMQQLMACYEIKELSRAERTPSVVIQHPPEFASNSMPLGPETVEVKGPKLLCVPVVIYGHP